MCRGHYYSPIPDINDIREKESSIWGFKPEKLGGIDLNVEEQLQYFESFKDFFPDMPFKATKSGGLRFYYSNPMYGWGDALILYSMMRKLHPRKIVEVGSGFSSCVLLDTNELFFQNNIELVFIEPDPDRLMSLIKKDDLKRNSLIQCKLQDTNIKEFTCLQNNDILLIDSSHVSKIDSDVNHLFFDILPALSPGVYVHFHDIFYPFEYPAYWIYEGRAWTEAYLLRAFLQYNNSFKIVLFFQYLVEFHKELFEKYAPSDLKNRGGNIWLKKIK